MNEIYKTIDAEQNPDAICGWFDVEIFDTYIRIRQDKFLTTSDIYITHYQAKQLILFLLKGLLIEKSRHHE